jgi:hypothetical protein
VGVDVVQIEPVGLGIDLEMAASSRAAATISVLAH